MANLVPGLVVWVEDETLAWTEAEIISVDGNVVTVKKEITGGTSSHRIIKVPSSNCFPKDLDAPNGGVDDMTKLAYLHEPGVLDNLRSRYELDEIYTYTGSILIAVNPFAKLPHLYDVPMMEQYRGLRLGELSPHVFAIAESAYRAMVDDRQSQSILVSGESGAGKTETTKLIMQYLAYMGGRAATDGRTVESQVLESNPLLEAFGNAKTVRNENSSRFGKFVEIQFDKSGRISGAAIRTYLLERSRVVQVSDPERNYHCFYQLCAGASSEEVHRYKLGPAKSFHYLNQSSCFELLGKDNNATEFERTKQAMDIVGVSPEEQDSVFRTLAAILHLGNISFGPGKELDSSEPADDLSRFHLEAAAELLMCDAKGLQEALCTRTMVTVQERIKKDLDPEAAVASRDTMAKTIYSRLFDWLVEKINKSIGQDPDSKTLIGVLDIYGFESFKVNSFEQFCINLANEKLQQHFNQHVFKMEQEEYTREAIEWSYIDFVDNQDVLDLIEKKPVGILALLDEQCMFPRSTHATFATKLFQELGKHKRLSKPKFSQTNFTLDHYAGEVTYQTDLFLEKNKDYVVADHQNLLGASRCLFMSELFKGPGGDAKTKFSSLGNRFKQQLGALMETLTTTEPHYIRCVKPNVLNKPNRFESGNVLQQLRCGGVLEAVRISCAGYPTRRSFDDFLDRFALLAPDLLDGRYSEKAAVEMLLQRMELSNYQVGKTMVFLRAGQMAVLDTARADKLYAAAQVIQRSMRSILQRKQFLRLRKAVVKIQALWRGTLARRQYQLLRKEVAALKLQRVIRRWQAQNRFRKVSRAALVLQSGFRGMAARKKVRSLRKNRAAVKLQAAWRRHRDEVAHKKLRWSAVVFQSVWRARNARKELRSLKLEARQAGALQAAKTKLEKECEELTWRLQLEKRLRLGLEEAKAHEILTLQTTLDEVRAELAEARAQLSSQSEERTTAAIHPLPQVPKATEEEIAHAAAIPHVNKELELKAEKLMVENERLKALLDESDTRAADAETQLAESADRSGRLEAAELSVQQLHESLARLEEHSKQLEQENQVLRQQALSLTPTKVMGPRQLSMPGGYYQRNFENGGSLTSSPGSDHRLMDSPSDMDRQQTELEQKRQKLLNDRQQHDQEALLQCVVTDVGFSQKRPVAACVVYKCLLQWRSFEAERTNVFDRIIQTIGGAIESQESNIILGYWLSNTATLLFLLQRTLKATGSMGTSQQRRRPTSTLFNRMTQGFRGSPVPSSAMVNGGSGSALGVDQVRQVDAKYPALLFKQQLTAYVEKIYGMIRDNLKKDISPMLGSCIQAPRTSRSGMGRGPMNNRSPGSHQTQTLSSHWGSIITSLSGLLNTMRANHVPPFLVRKLFTQIFSFINVQLFNSLLLRRECCSFSNGEYVKAGLAELEHWIYEASQEYAGSSWDELKYIRQAVGFLVIHQKPKKSLDEITHDLCPVLSIQQLYRISTMYWDDKYGTHSVSQDVISSMRVLMTEDSNSAISNSFLLDDDSSIPFSVEDISKSMQDVELADIPPPEILSDNSSFGFLQPHQ